MLRALRSGKQSILIKIVTGGLMVMALGGLVLMDVQGVFQGGISKTTIARIDGTSLTNLEFDRILQNAMTRERLSKADAYRNGLPQQVLDQEINSRLFGRAAYDAGLLVDDASAARYVRDVLMQPLMSQGLGEHDALTLILRSLSLSEQQLMNSVKSQIASENLLLAVASGAHAPAQMVNDALKFRYEARRAEYFTLGTAEIGSVPEPTPEDITKHYEATQSRYMLPEFRTLAVLVLDADRLGVQSNVSAEDIQAYYEDNIRDYSTAEEREIEQLVVKDEETAKAIQAAATASKDLRQAVKDVVKDATVNVVSGTYSEDDISEELADAAFKTTAAGDVSAPVQSAFGWHIVRVVKITKPGTQRKLEDVTPDITKRLAAEKSAEAVYEIVGAIDDSIGAGTSVGQIASEYKLKETVFEKIDMGGVNAAGRTLDLVSIPTHEKVLETAFRLKQGEASQLIETPEGEFVIVEAREIIAPAAKPLDQVRADVVKHWKASKKNALLDVTASKVMERLNMGEGFDKIAASFSKKTERSQMLRRDSAAELAPLGKGMIPALFTIDKPGQTVTVRGDNSLSFVRMVERRVDMPKETAAEEAKMLQAALSRSLQNDLLAQYRLALMKKYDVVVNYEVLDTLYAPKDDEDDMP